MAARFWVGGTGNWDAATTTHWAASSGGAGGQSVPGASDDVTFDNLSGAETVTITATQSVLSMTGGTHTGTLNFNAQTVTTGTFNWSGTGTRTLTFSSASLNVTGNSFNVNSSTNLTITANTATITLSGTTVTMNASTINYNGASFVFSGSGTATLNGTPTFANLTRTGTTGKVDLLSLSGTVTVTSAFTVNSNSAINRVLIQSDTVGTPRTISAGSVVISNIVDFQDITGSGAATWTVAGTGATALGNCGGNSGITFTTSATQTWSGTTGGNWSTNAWSGRVPLPQDNVVINAAFSASQTISIDLPRIGASIDWTGATGTPRWDFSTTPTGGTSCFGSITLISAMTFVGAGVLTLRGRDSFTLTSAGLQYTGSVSVNCFGGTYTLNDAFSTVNTFTLITGGWNDSGFNTTAGTAASGVQTIARSLTMSGVWTLSNSSIPWVFSNTTGLTFSGANSTILITNSAATTRTFAGGGLTYGKLSMINSTANTRILVITGANTFNTINFYNPTGIQTITFPSATTTTITGTLNIQGRMGSGNQVTINSSTPASAATISKASGIVSSNYLSIQDSTASGGATFYAGDNSTSVSNNSGWIFTSAPNTNPGGTDLLLGV